MRTLVVVDCQNDFIAGSLACEGSEKAVENIIRYINDKKVDNVVYSADSHSESNKSFFKNGGIWPSHCVKGLWGSELSEEFKKIEDEKLRPNPKNTYLKGENDEVEEYSAYYGKNVDKESLSDVESEEFVICGLASEYCVRETLLEFIKNNKKVSLFLDGVGYVNLTDHENNIDDLRGKKIEIIWT